MNSWNWNILSSNVNQSYLDKNFSIKNKYWVKEKMSNYNKKKKKEREGKT